MVQREAFLMDSNRWVQVQDAHTKVRLDEAPVPRKNP